MKEKVKLSVKDIMNILRIEREAIAYDNRLIPGNRELMTQEALAREVLRRFNKE